MTTGQYVYNIRQENPTSRFWRASSIATLTTAGVCVGTLSGVAVEPAASVDANHVAALVADASSDYEGDLVVPELSSTGLVAAAEEGTVALPGTATGEVQILGSSGVPITVSLPEGTGSAPAEVADDGSIIYASDDAMDIAVQVTVNETRIHTVLNSSDSPSELAYEFRGVTPFLEEDGSVVLVSAIADGIVYDVGAIDTPWAVDADGRALATRYRIDGNTMTQEIEVTASTQFPVVADPAIQSDCGIITCTTRFDRATTKKLSNKTGLIGIATAIGTSLGGGPAVTITGAYLALFSTYATNYYNNGNCFALKMAPATGTRWAEQVKRKTYNCR